MLWDCCLSRQSVPYPVTSVGCRRGVNLPDTGRDPVGG